MKQKYEVATEYGPVQVYLNDGSIFLNDGLPRNIFGEVIPEADASKHSIRRIRIASLDPEDEQRLEAVIQRELEAIITESIEDIV